MKLTIGKKITLGFFIITLIFILSLLATTFMIYNINDGYSNAINESADLALKANDLKSIELEKVVTFRELIISKDMTKIDKIKEYDTEFQKLYKELNSMVQTQEGKDILKKISTANEEYTQFTMGLNTYISNNQQEELVNLVASEGDQKISNMITSAEELESLGENSLNEARTNLTRESKAVIQGNLGILIIVPIICIILALIISYIITKPIKRLTKFTKIIAQGDLTIDNIKIKNKDEVGQLADSCNLLFDNLKNVVRKISSSSEEVNESSNKLMFGSQSTSSASEEISASIQDVSINVENQSDSVNKMEITITEMSAGMEQISNNMQEININANKINNRAESGMKSAENVVKQMEIINNNSTESVKIVKELGELSKKVEDIIKLITDISSQTNLLALNAAIEAARAGEHGKGFSVVADEVRKLAEQSNDAAIEISNTIQDMNKEIDTVVTVIQSGASEVEKGSIVVNEVTNSFSDITKAFDEIFTQVQEVSAATQEMTASSEEVVASIDSLAEGANKNLASIQNVVAAVEEQSASLIQISDRANALSELASDLDTAVKVFKL